VSNIVSFKCTKCQEEFADFDISEEEMAMEDVETDSEGSILIVCADCVD